ncbi:hypothetical protein DINM_002463 [Dirofilaria immitis]|nr:hypothetical protein [Dirofilaria immitis]
MDGAGRGSLYDSSQIYMLLCGLTENCRYGIVEISGRTHTYRYKDEIYYMLDPFRNRSTVNGRRLTETRINAGNKTFEGSKAASIFDILVLGAICSMCGQPVCIGENCSVFYVKTICIACVNREKTCFPKTFIEQIDTSRKQHKAGRKEVKRSV